MSTAADKLRIAFALFEDGVAMQRQNLRREHPEADDEHIELMVRHWLRIRPGADHGDAEGRPAALHFA